MIALAAAAAALLLAAEPTPPADPAAETSCTARLSGAVAATFACAVEIPYDAQKVTLTIKPQGALPAGVKALVPARFELAPPLSAATYTLATMGTGESRVVLASGAAYVASGARGEVTLEFSGLERYQKPRTRYQATGLLRARLLPATPAGQGEIHLEVQF